MSRYLSEVLVAFYVDTELDACIKEEASKRGLSYSEVVTEAVNVYLNKPIVEHLPKE